jgi:hypothetical protein
MIVDNFMALSFSSYLDNSSAVFSSSFTSGASVDKKIEKCANSSMMESVSRQVTYF